MAEVIVSDQPRRHRPQHVTNANVLAVSLLLLSTTLLLPIESFTPIIPISKSNNSLQKHCVWHGARITAPLCAFHSRSTNDDNANQNSHDPTTTTLPSRRMALSTATATLATIFLPGVSPGNAFPNKISDKYDDRPKRKGPKPKDLGVATRKDMIGEEYLGLKPCGPAPNCFCSTDSAEDDPDHSIPSWTYPTSKHGSVSSAFRELESVIGGYKPGQGNIDGGGFAVVSSDVEKGYIYVQFEALKNGYIDDFEVAVVSGGREGEVQVRSSSRVGYLDFGVNAKRLNYIAKELREKGWDAVGVDYKTHRGYVSENNLS